MQFGIGFSSDGGFKLAGETKPDPAKTIARLKNNLNGTDKDAEAYLQLSRLYKKEEKVLRAATKAAEFARQRLKTDPDNSALWVLLAESLARGKQYQEAEKTFRQAVARFPRDADCQLAFGQFLSG